MKTLGKTLAVSGLLLALAACGGGGGGPIKVTVDGIVLDSSGNPVSGANLLLNGANLKTTGADGKFSYSEVTPPYNLTLKVSNNIVEYRGLTRLNPRLSTSSSAGYSASIAGSVTGPTYPLAAGEAILISGTNNLFGFISAASATGNYSGSIGWTGTPNKTADLVALRLKSAAGVISDYLQTGKRAGVSFTNGVGQTGLNIALDSPVPNGTTSFNFTLGAYTSSSSGRLFAVKANGALFWLGGGLTYPSGSSVKVPNEGSTFVVQGEDATGNRVAVIASGSVGGAVNINLPASTVLKNSLPVDAATGISLRPDLSWTPVTGATLYIVTINGPTFSYSFYLPGSASSNLTLPDFTTLGAALSAATACSWSVTAIKSTSFTPDALTDPDGGNLTLTLLTGGDASLYTSKSTTFTTAP